MKDADILEVVQRRTTKLIPSLRNLSYEKRLKRLTMFFLRRTSFRGDMTEVFKMINDIDKVNIENIFCIDADGRTRKHSLCLKIKRHAHSNIGLKFFTRIVINYWNHLIGEVVS